MVAQRENSGALAVGIVEERDCKGTLAAGCEGVCLDKGFLTGALGGSHW